MFGGASFPVLVGAYTVTWPLAVLRADADGLSVDLRWRPLSDWLKWRSWNKP